MRPLVILLAFAVAAPASAQLQPGDRVRVWEAQRDVAPVELIGRLRVVDQTAITLDPSITVPWSAVRAVDVSAGPRSGPRWRSGLVGALVGALGGGILGVVVGDAGRHNAAKLGIAGLAGGAVVGGIVGAAMPGEAWRRVPIRN